jgi:hypothetical protein
LRYRIGRLDPRFHTTQDAFLQAIGKGIDIWEQAARRKLFDYDERASFTINLVYDDRQLIAENRDEMAWRHKADQARYEELKTRYESMKSSYETRLSAYNLDVESANRQGGVSREAYEQLQSERLDLQSTQTQLNSLVSQLNALGWSDQKDTAQYNEDAEKKFAAADCIRTGANMKINVYQFKNERDLALKLAHELGHALNLNHVSNPKSVMYYLIKEQEARELALTEEDKAALQAECRF